MTRLNREFSTQIARINVLVTSAMAKLLRAAHQQEAVTVLHFMNNAAETEDLGTIQFRMSDGKITEA